MGLHARLPGWLCLEGSSKCSVNASCSWWSPGQKAGGVHIRKQLVGREAGRVGSLVNVRRGRPLRCQLCFLSCACGFICNCLVWASLPPPAPLPASLQRTWVGLEGKAPAAHFQEVLPNPGGKEMNAADLALSAWVVGGTRGSAVVQAQEVCTWDGDRGRVGGGRWALPPLCSLSEASQAEGGGAPGLDEGAMWASRAT